MCVAARKDFLYVLMCNLLLLLTLSSSTFHALLIFQHIYVVAEVVDVPSEARRLASSSSLLLVAMVEML